MATLFMLLVLAAAAFMVFISQNRKGQLKLKLQLLEIQRQKEIAENTLISQEKERQRVGLELHDELGPTFAAIRFNTDRIKQKAEKQDNQSLSELAAQTSLELENAVNKFSHLSKILYPVVLFRHGLKDSLTELVENTKNNENTRFHLVFDINSELKEILSLTIYRICQECLTNARKHAKAKNVYFEIQEKDNIIELIYKDDGIGYDTSKDYIGLGLNSIKGRVEAMGGELKAISNMNEGVTYDIQVPKN